MRPTRPRSTSRSLVGAPLALLTLVLLASGAHSTARAAGCVHDGLRRGIEPAGAAHFVRLIEAGAMDAPAPDPAHAESTPDDPARPQPCDGPSCSNRSGLPIPPAPSIAPTTSPSWAWTQADPPASGPDGLRLPPADAPASPRHSGPSIFHPPRLSA